VALEYAILWRSRLRVPDDRDPHRPGSKLDLNNRVQIALLVHDAGLLDDDPG
jgi:hypothetical protein